MSHDFDVIGGTKAPTPPKIKPAATPANDAARQNGDTAADKMAAVPKQPANAK